MKNIFSKNLMQRLLSLAFLTCLIFSTTKSYTQENKEAPKNFISIFGGIEWNTISGLAGVDYERIVFTENNFNVGVKGIYVFKYKHENLQILNGGCCEYTSFGAVMATGTLYTSKVKQSSGFLLNGGLGLSLNNHQVSEFKETKLQPAFEAGFGWSLFNASKFSLKWTNNILVATPNGVITLTRLSVGF